MNVTAYLGQYNLGLASREVIVIDNNGGQGRKNMSLLAWWVFLYTTSTSLQTIAHPGDETTGSLNNGAGQWCWQVSWNYPIYHVDKDPNPVCLHFADATSYFVYIRLFSQHFDNINYKLKVIDPIFHWQTRLCDLVRVCTESATHKCANSFWPSSLQRNYVIICIFSSTKRPKSDQVWYTLKDHRNF